jgi:hypothetical protein
MLLTVFRSSPLTRTEKPDGVVVGSKHQLLLVKELTVLYSLLARIAGTRYIRERKQPWSGLVQLSI